MTFYLLDVEQVSETSLALFCKETNSPFLLKKLILKNIKPTYLVLSNDESGEEMENYFYKNVPLKCKFMRTNLETNTTFCIKEFSSPLEQFIISKKIKGPGIIELRNYQESTSGEILIGSMDEIIGFKHEKMPPLKIMTLIVNEGKDLEYFYTNVQFYNSNKVTHFSCGTKYLKGNFSKKCHNLNEVLYSLNDFIEKENPDLILFHNLHPLIQKRLNFYGRLVCDLFVLAPSFLKSRNFSLEEIYFALFKKNFIDFSKENMLKMIYDCFISMNILELSKELTEICGNLLKRTLLNFRAERNEYFLLHEFYANKILFPPKEKREGESYEGGLVLEPKTGFYETKVLLLDFNSLYPSIIQEYNICFSNLDGTKKELGILPRILKNLVERRREVKVLMKRSNDSVLNTKQLALKLIANSIYGCLGTPNFRFCNFELAKQITFHGRQILQEAKILAEQLGLNVIYGDTDSIMIDSQKNVLEKEGEDLKNIINKKYKFIEIEIEKVYKRILLLKKKKYGAITTKNVIETKGLDSVRRDFCLISSEIASKVLEIILKDSDKIFNNGNVKILQQIYSFLAEKKNNLEKEPQEKFVINACLAKPLEKYANPDILPHVSLAYRLRKRNIFYKKDDVIGYVIGLGEKGESISKRACLPGENKIDYEYYINNQILPPLNRLLTYIKGIDFDHIANIFGVKKVYVSRSNFNFKTLCCNESQSSLSECKKCKQPINKIWLNNLIRNTLRENTTFLYNYEMYCSCGCVTKTPIKKCLVCHRDFLFSCNNDKFDSLLESLAENEIAEEYLKVSEYRKIDLRIFEEEISYFKEKYF
ncbi:DNA polymerase (pol2) [Tubulinosema ratisbonensis]|uniref:DNA polymerase n=1 Tax=Tubulinosema ratisbonensis TaxID=291195 RepID=A0A437AIH4_9MICR|nr:DNA polymerase (pol2) [Tubulinosema ratisbonensis]